MNNAKITTIALIALIAVTAVYALQEVLVLNLEVSKDGDVELLDFYLGEGEKSFELSDGDGDYRIELVSRDNKVLYSSYFTPKFELHIDAPPEGEEFPEAVLLEKTRVSLKIPYTEGTEKLRVFYKNQIKLEEAIVFCNNNSICEPSGKESSLSCPSDCKSGSTDNYCDAVFDGVCDQDCANQGREDKDVDCTCGNGICDQRETEKLCQLDCKIELSFWQKVLDFIKSKFT